MPQVRRVFPSELFGPGGSVLVILLITQQVLGVFKLADTARKERDMGNMFCHPQLKVEIMLGCDCSKNCRTTVTEVGKDP